MTDKRISDILNAGDILQNTLDPEGILSNGKTTRIVHKLSDDGKGFNWKCETYFPNEDCVILYGRFHESIGYYINRCLFVHDDEKHDVPLKPSETVLEAFGELTRLPARLKNNLVRISPEIIEKGKSENTYGMQNCRSAADAVFWGVEGGDSGNAERIKFREITVTTKKDSGGYFTKSTIVAACQTGHSIIRARVTVDMYGLGAQAVTLEKGFGNKDEISAYCYTEDMSGRKMPSLNLAFRLDRLLAGNDKMNQRVKENKIEMPSANLSEESVKKTQEYQKNQNKTGKHHKEVTDPNISFRKNKK